MSEPNFLGLNKDELMEALSDKSNLKQKAKLRPPVRKPSSPVADIIQAREMLDRIWCINNNIDQWLLAHPTIKQHTEWTRWIEEAKHKLTEVYLEAGSM